MTHEQKFVIDLLWVTMKRRESSARWRSRNAKKIKEWNKATNTKRLQTHPEQVQSYITKWRKEHPERSRENRKAWRIENPESAKETERKNRINHPETKRAVSHRRRAREFGQSCSFTPAQWLALLALYGNRCLGCRRSERELRAAGLKLVPDHVQSLKLGGTSDIGNIQPLCHGASGCNNRKGAKHVDYRPGFPLEIT